MTAVEFLMLNIFPFKNRHNEEISHIITILEQAKEMEKQQIIDAYANAVMKENNNDYVGMHEQSSGEIYFSETYESKGSDDTKTDKI